MLFAIIRNAPNSLATIQRVRWLAFSLSSFFADLAGSLHAISYEQAGPATVGAQTSALILFMTYIGGIGSFLGPIVGATNAELKALGESR